MDLGPVLLFFSWKQLYPLVSEREFLIMWMHIWYLDSLVRDFVSLIALHMECQFNNALSKDFCIVGMLEVFFHGTLRNWVVVCAKKCSYTVVVNKNVANLI